MTTLTTYSIGMPVNVTLRWGRINPQGLSAWDAARLSYGAEAFEALRRDDQIAAVQHYVNAPRCVRAVPKE